MKIKKLGNNKKKGNPFRDKHLMVKVAKCQRISCLCRSKKGCLVFFRVLLFYKKFIFYVLQMVERRSSIPDISS